MSLITLSPLTPQGTRMAKKSAGREPVGRQINFRAPDSVVQDLDFIANVLNLDVSALIRLILAENLHSYKARARALLEARDDGRRSE